MKTIHLLLLGTALAFSSCNNTPAAVEKDNVNEKKEATLSNDEMKQIVEERNKTYGQAMIDGDSAALVDHFTSDVIVWPTNGPAFIGKAAITPALVAFSKMGFKTFEDVTKRVTAAGDYIIEEGVGRTSMKDPKSPGLGTINYVCVWKKEDGVWRVYSNIWNSAEAAKN